MGPRDAAARVRELAEELEELAEAEAADGTAGPRMETVAVLGLAWIAVAVCEAIGRAAPE